MNKAELIKSISAKLGFKKADVEVLVNVIFDEIGDCLAKGEKVRISGFGTFEVRERAARKGRNPQTGEEIDIPASKVPVFKAAKALKDLVK